jgi:hypothetical protein
MAPVDLNKNREGIVKAHKEVSDPHGKTNWALFGYEGQSDVLKVVSKGDGGIEEMLEDLSSGKIMYAYIKVIDSNTNLPKFVFINWQGEGVPEGRKGACASHVRDVQNLLRGAHVSINARTEDDVDEKTIQLKVSKASGANYSFHKEEKKPMPAIGPVGSVYEKVRPQIEIKPDIREKFWEDSEKEEKQRILLEKQRLAQEKGKLEKEAKEREEREQRAREQREAERLRKIRDIKDAEKQASAHDKAADKSHWDESDAKRDEEERAKRSDQMRKDRAAEAKSLASGRTAGARSMFEQKPTSQFEQDNKAPPPSRKLKQPAFLDNSQSTGESAQRKKPIELPKGSPSPPTSPASPPTRAPAAAPAAPQPPVPRSEPADDTYDDASAVQRQAPPSQQPQVRNLLAEGMPRRPPSDDEEEYQNWEDDAAAPAAAAPAAATYTEDDDLYQDTGNVSAAPADADDELYQDAGDVSRAQQHHDDNEELYEDTTNVEGKGVCAKALYDYVAGEENEITFDPDEIITDIEMIDEGWWIGTAPDGRRGMFPSNYVQLI